MEMAKKCVKGCSGFLISGLQCPARRLGWARLGLDEGLTAYAIPSSTVMGSQ